MDSNSTNSRKGQSYPAPTKNTLPQKTQDQISIGQFFVKVFVADYVDKNNLETKLKEVIQQFDGTLMHWSKIDAFMERISWRWSEAHQELKNCKPILLEKDINILPFKDPNQDKSFSVGAYRIGEIFIYPVIQENQP